MLKKILNPKSILRVTALFLWYFVVVFLFIVWDINNGSPLLQEGTTIGKLMVRYPYQWDFELFFAGLFLVWGIFIWRAGKDISASRSLIQFTGWAFLVHAITMIIVGLIKTDDLIHMLNDSIYWFIFGTLTLYSARK